MLFSFGTAFVKCLKCLSYEERGVIYILLLVVQCVVPNYNVSYGAMRMRSSSGNLIQIGF